MKAVHALAASLVTMWMLFLCPAPAAAQDGVYSRRDQQQRDQPPRDRAGESAPAPAALVPAVMDLVNLAPALSGARNCAVEVLVDGTQNIGVFFTRGPAHTVSFPVSPRFTGNPKISFRGSTKRTSGVPPCAISVDIDYSQVKRVLWDQWMSTADAKVRSCVARHLAKVGLRLPDAQWGEGVPIPQHGDVERVRLACTDLSRFPLRADFACQVNSGILRKTLDGQCSEKFAVVPSADSAPARGGQPTARPLQDEDEAIQALLDGRRLTRVQVETDGFRKARLAEEERQVAEDARREEERRKEEARVAEARRADTERRRKAEEEEAARRAAEQEKRRQWLESPEGKKQIAEQEEKERRAAKLAAEKEEAERRKNFLLGLCEIPPSLALSECTEAAIFKLDAPAGSYQVFTPYAVRFTTMSSNQVPREVRMRKVFEVRVRYEIDEPNSTVKAYISDTRNQCVTEMAYKKTLFGIRVTRGPQSGSCSEDARAIHNALAKEYSMKYKRVDP